MTCDKEQSELRSHDYDPALKEEFDAAVKEVLFSPNDRAKYENRKPPKKELEKKWRLERK